MSERQIDGLPEQYNLFPRLTKFGAFLGRCVSQFVHVGISDHRHHETPPERPQWPETMVYADPLERIHDLVDDRPPHLDRWEDDDTAA